MINLAVNLAPVNSYKISVIKLVYLPSNQSLANSLGTLTITVSLSNFSAAVLFSQVSKLGLLIFPSILFNVAVQSSSIFSKQYSFLSNKMDVFLLVYNVHKIIKLKHFYICDCVYSFLIYLLL